MLGAFPFPSYLTLIKHILQGLSPTAGTYSLKQRLVRLKKEDKTSFFKTSFHVLQA